MLNIFDIFFKWQTPACSHKADRVFLLVLQCLTVACGLATNQHDVYTRQILDFNFYVKPFEFLCLKRHVLINILHCLTVTWFPATILHDVYIRHFYVKYLEIWSYFFVFKILYSVFSVFQYESQVLYYWRLLKYCISSFRLRPSFSQHSSCVR